MSFNRSEIQAKLTWEEHVRIPESLSSFYLMIHVKGEPREGPVTILPQSIF
jgi:hypothetical protein